MKNTVKCCVKWLSVKRTWTWRYIAENIDILQHYKDTPEEQDSRKNKYITFWDDIGSQWRDDDGSEQ